MVNRSLDLALGNTYKLELVSRGTKAEFVENLTQLLEKTDFLVQVLQSLLVNPKNIMEVDLKKRTILLENGEEDERNCG